MMNGEDVLGEDLNERATTLLTENDWFEMPVRYQLKRIF